METVNILEDLLNDEYVLYLKTRKYHWNVTGIHFYSLHKQLELQYQILDLIADELAERIRKLGGFVKITHSSILQSHLKDEKHEHLKDKDILTSLLFDHSYLIKKYRNAIEKIDADPGSEDLLTLEVQKHEKINWELKSLLDINKF